MPKVFVVQEMPHHNISSALKYGEIDVLLPTNTQIAFSLAPTIRRLRRKLRDYTDADWLLLTGDPAAIGLTCAIAASFNGGRFKCLKWDRRDNCYIPVTCDTTQNGEFDE